MLYLIGSAIHIRRWGTEWITSVLELVVNNLLDSATDKTLMKQTVFATRSIEEGSTRPCIRHAGFLISQESVNIIAGASF